MFDLTPTGTNFVSHLLRADISPLDAALGLQALRKVRPALNIAKKLSATIRRSAPAQAVVRASASAVSDPGAE